MKSNVISSSLFLIAMCLVSALGFYALAFTMPVGIWELEIGSSKELSGLAGYIVSLWLISYATHLLMAGYRYSIEDLPEHISEFLLGKFRVAVWFMVYGVCSFALSYIIFNHLSDLVTRLDFLHVFCLNFAILIFLSVLDGDISKVKFM